MKTLFLAFVACLVICGPAFAQEQIPSRFHVPSASADIVEPQQYQNFEDWCKDKKVSKSIKSFIEAVLSDAQTTNCHEAEETLRKKKQLNIPSNLNYGPGYCIQDVAPLVQMTYLESLHLDNNGCPQKIGAIDLSPLSRLQDLRDLRLSGSGFDPLKLAALASLINLESLTLRPDFDHSIPLDSWPSADLSPLSSLANLKTLELCIEKIDWNMFPAFPNLETLAVWGGRTSGAGSERLALSPKLKTLYLSVPVKIVESLPDLPNLKALKIHIAYTDLLSLDFLKNMPGLEELSIADPYIYLDLRPISQLGSLKYLAIGEGPVPAEYTHILEPLDGLTQLEVLEYRARMPRRVTGSDYREQLHEQADELARDLKDVITLPHLCYIDTMHNPPFFMTKHLKRLGGLTVAQMIIKTNL